MDYLLEGINQGNLIITSIVMLVLVISSTKARFLDTAGVAAAAFIGLLVGLLGHWSWLLILLSFLVFSHLATKWKFEEKKSRNMAESDDGHRGWVNVFANGGIPALIATIAFLNEEWEYGLWMFGAAVSVAAADTFASEFGCLDDNVRMITTFKKCEPGINGGYSKTGQLAAFCGALIIGLMTFSAWYVTNLDEPMSGGISLMFAVIIIGWIGCQIDSFLGAWFENRGYLTKGGVNTLAITSGMLIMFAWLNY
ncbi:MAG TPA: DUF92 domain-containing protein [Candidatus Poseidoniales archaeon]|nr:MAG TPA: DUF92 domain-containing protein [Candidatus Poseidoniales archaeon]HII50281.1 DUF92 domain-containing protein [Candidatus Poseidoniaceae archaeon]|tara:strand:- start:848 stop:1606 length:759 start_codon:yes stop_codon:yes gene_type:complete